MTEIQRAKREVSMRFWQKTILKCRASGLTIAAFCRQHDLNANAYYYWQRQIRQNLLQEQTLAIDSAPKTQSVHPSQNTLPKTSACQSADIVSLSAALHITESKPAAAVISTAPAITMHYGKLDIDIRDGTPPELLRMVMSFIREEDALC